MNSDTLSQLKRRAGLRQRLMAWMLSQRSPDYEQAVSRRKQTLIGSLQGDILEIGPGAGPNLPFYAAGVHWLGVEPNPFMHAYLLKAIQQLGLSADRYRVDPGDARGIRLPAEDSSMDAVVSTLVLCSVPDPDASLQEILRVLKPGGRFVFIEHVAAEKGTRLRTFQNLLQPVWSLVGGGCHPNRETWETISRAGFARVEIEHFEYPGGGLVGPHIAGKAETPLIPDFQKHKNGGGENTDFKTMKTWKKKPLL
ncbi:MAG TPA: class I SAM-dependent methyltransferase [Anaerolineaceae bacterium]|nr:class I SAM-dependent methyltransferase [Anaerolineaceae bacterium]